VGPRRLVDAARSARARSSAPGGQRLEKSVDDDVSRRTDFGTTFARLTSSELISADARRRFHAPSDVASPGNRRLITRRSQVQILPPLLKRPCKAGPFVYQAGATQADFIPSPGTRAERLAEAARADALAWTAVVVSLGSSPRIGLAHSLLTGRGREFDADADDCASSIAQAMAASAQTPPSTRKRKSVGSSGCHPVVPEPASSYSSCRRIQSSDAGARESPSSRPFGARSRIG
jgi:hypothetical protein